MQSIGKRVALSTFLLSMLVVSAVGTPAASAAGTKQFTCSEAATVKLWSDAHCTNRMTLGKYGHVAFSAQTERWWSIGTISWPWLLQTVVSGVSFELQATEVGGAGTLVNGEEGGESYAAGEGVIALAGVTVLKPAGKGCKVFGNEALTEEGKITTNSLSETTKGQGDALKFTPASGTEIGAFWISGCSVAALNGKYSITGSFLGVPNGGEVVFSHSAMTEANTLKVRGSKAGFSAGFTRQGRANSGEDYKAITFTT